MLRRISLSLGGVLALLAALELLFRLLPVSTATLTGYYIDPQVLTYPPGHRWWAASGWDLRNAHHLQANNWGFASDVDFTPDPAAVALIGDSYVEASMLDYAQRPGSQLAQALARFPAQLPATQRPVYAMGAPGSALLDYAERIRLSNQKLGVRDFVLLMEAGDVRQSLCGSGNVHGPCLDRQTLQPRVELLPPPSLAKRILRQSALAQYIFGQLKVNGARLFRQAFFPAPPAAAGKATAASARVATPVSDAAAAQRQAMVQAVADEFFARIAPYAHGRLVLVVDGRRSRQALESTDAALAPMQRERDTFMAIARAKGATVIDAEALYRQHWAGSQLSLDVSPSDGHLNPIGIKLVMDAAAQALQ